MKTTIIVGSLFVAMGIGSLHSQTINGQKLNISTQSSGNNTVTGSYSGAIGQTSSVPGSSSLSVGYSNTIGGYNNLGVGYGLSISSGAQSLMVGSGLSLDEISSVAIGNQSSYSGYSGYYYGNCNLYLGNYNDGQNNFCTAVFGSFHDVSSSEFSMIAGYAHTVAGLSGGMIVGKTHVATGQQFLIGTGLIAQVTGAPSVVVGQYNKAQQTPQAGQPAQVFVVGAGTSSSPSLRKNAIEVYADGKVILPQAQGDISMGEFGY